MFSGNHFKIEEYIDRAKKSGGINARNKKKPETCLYGDHPHSEVHFSIFFLTLKTRGISELSCPLFAPRYLPLDFIILSQNNHNNFITSQDTEKFVILILKIIPETVIDGSFRVFFVQILRKEGTFVYRRG